tara:strand:+ start:40732 stop:41652 length:921 start_codon:yes stop_codon:yes gene_type:complete
MLGFFHQGLSIAANSIKLKSTLEERLRRADNLDKKNQLKAKSCVNEAIKATDFNTPHLIEQKVSDLFKKSGVAGVLEEDKVLRLAAYVMELVLNSLDPEKGEGSIFTIAIKDHSILLLYNGKVYNPRNLLSEEDGGGGKKALTYFFRPDNDLVISHKYEHFSLDTQNFNEVHIELNPNYQDLETIKGSCVIIEDTDEAERRLHQSSVDITSRFNRLSRPELTKLAMENVESLSDRCSIVEIVVPNKPMAGSTFHNYYHIMAEELLKRGKRVVIYIRNDIRIFIDDMAREFTEMGLKTENLKIIKYD